MNSLHTALGIILSFLITVCGWFTTEWLLTQKENTLLSARGNVPINTTIDVSSQNSVSAEKSPDTNSHVAHSPVTLTNDYPKLTSSEIYTILSQWTLRGTQRPHEPTAGQLSMEQAIGMGREWTEYFCQNGLIPMEALDFRESNAYLAVNEVDNAQIPFDNPQVKQDEIREDTLLEPFFSYWTVVFSGADMDITLTINAGTGQVWRAEITSRNMDIPYTRSVNELLAAFTDYIGTDGINEIIDISADVNLSALDGEIMFGYALLSLYPI
jgi:hypothetical protein